MGLMPPDFWAAFLCLAPAVVAPNCRWEDSD